MDKIILEIEKIVAGGDGMAFCNGKVHFVPGVLPGEKIEAKITQEKKGFNRCELLRVIVPGKDRVEPFCKFFDICGGCSLQYTTYKKQLELKEDIVRDVFKRTGKIDLKDFKIYSSTPKGYRNRIQLHRSGETIGFKAKGSDKIVDIDNCPLLVDGLNSCLKNRVISGSKATVFSPGEEYFIGGVDSKCSVHILGKTLNFNPKGFFQSNLSILPDLIGEVNSFLTGESFMDLYCGVGLFSSFIPKGRVVAVEQDSRVKEFVDLNTSSNVEFYNTTLEKFVKNYKGESFDTVIVDPPRKGLSQEVRTYLLKMKPKRIIYVSCDPVTMARDVKELTEKGYKLSHYSMFDFYPQTPHIESFGVLDLE